MSIHYIYKNILSPHTQMQNKYSFLKEISIISNNAGNLLDLNIMGK